MAVNPSRESEPPPLSVAAVARRLGVAPATLRTWDRRYGIGPSDHRAGERRRYGADDLSQLESMRRLLMQGVGAADAARLVRDAAVTHPPPSMAAAPPAPAAPAAASGAPGDTQAIRRLREAALRIDVDRTMTLLAGAVRGRRVIDFWDGVICPVLVSLGDRWEAKGDCVAAEHVFSECVSRVLHDRLGPGPTRETRPALLACAPGEAHVLALQALAAALTEAGVAARLVGAATPVPAMAQAARRTTAAAVVVWSQTAETADAHVFTAVSRARSGRLLAAAGPGWRGVDLPARVVRLHNLGEAVAALADLTG